MDSRVSVVVTTYYRNDALGDAIESVLAQTYEPVEIVVVDDSGEGHAEPVVADYDVRYLAHEENRDQHRAWATGLDATDGAYVQFLDDDDLLRPTKLERQVAVLDSTPGVGVVYCGVDAPGGVVRPDPDARGDVLDRALVFDLSPCYTSSMLVDRSCLERVRPLPRSPNRTDTRLMIDLARETRFDFVADALVEQRALDDRRREQLTDEHVRILDEHLHLASKPVRTQMLHLYHRGRCAWELSTNPWSPRAVASGVLACYYMLRLGRVVPSTLGYAAVSLFGRPGYRLGRALWPN